MNAVAKLFGVFALAAGVSLATPGQAGPITLLDVRAFDGALLVRDVGGTPGFTLFVTPLGGPATFSYTIPPNGFYRVFVTAVGEIVGETTVGGEYRDQLAFTGHLSFTGTPATGLTAAFNGEVSPALTAFLNAYGITVPSPAVGTISVGLVPGIVPGQIGLSVSGTGAFAPVETILLGLVGLDGREDLSLGIKQLTVTAEAIPEPAALALLGLGVAGLMALRRREAQA
ncbi:MAG: PEP-CTERM sorting domain-containing protein [Elioraea sp.]|nr:PEP-CTERM sorting domain-containing protein [Elioraea sp.]